MNITKLLSLLALSTTLSFSQTTMCFKQNHKDFSTLEKTPLDGGACDSKKSLTQMKTEGWSVSDIKIDNNNYIYILKKDELTIKNIDLQALENQILKRLEQKEEIENKNDLAERKMRMSISGKNMYIQKCQSCHGEKGEALPGQSRALDNMSLFDFMQTIRDYNNGSGYDRGTAFQMLPYANLMDKKDINNVYLYLQSINQKEETPTNKN
ncbi:MAG: hypothetical protein C0626_11545 [Arcobacter sp.]|uniref:c-type cytochrome n=1 Tax=uncultured Arcobacter sp. TaxID=165434 RepID=UPI000CBE0F25|nr:c-type cytochrome [uncultured Arcobacter sp.]PLY09589.1 MAG: hypothetical protein C0626_11545 [Arcobacter sp.]